MKIFYEWRMALNDERQVFWETLASLDLRQSIWEGSTVGMH